MRLQNGQTGNKTEQERKDEMSLLKFLAIVSKNILPFYVLLFTNPKSIYCLPNDQIF